MNRSNGYQADLSTLISMRLAASRSFSCASTVRSFSSPWWRSTYCLRPEIAVPFTLTMRLPPRELRFAQRRLRPEGLDYLVARLDIRTTDEVDAIRNGGKDAGNL